MAEYSVTFARSARKELQALDATVATRVLRRLEVLAISPRPTGVIKIEGTDDLWRSASRRLADHLPHLGSRKARRHHRYPASKRRLLLTRAVSMWVVKLGGSLAKSEELPRWLEVIATAGTGKAVLVPGGGPWADEVREAQKREKFDDRVAHRKALRAMEQYGRVLAATHPGFTTADSIAAIREVLKKNRVAVWMPYEMVVADPLIPENWDVTSDTLAAWLAGKLNATVLLLVKSFPISEPQSTIEHMVRRGWVDPAFPQFISSGRFQVRVLGHRDQEAASQMLASGTLVGVPIPG